MDLPKGSTVLSQDERPIAKIFAKGDLQPWFVLGVGGCTKIEAYDESGHMSCVPWIAVFIMGTIHLRVPADHVAIQYA